MNNKNNFIVPVIILGISLIISAVVIAYTWKSNYASNQTITVTGSAKKDIISDFGILRGTITVRGVTAETAFKELQREKPILIDYLESKGFTGDKIEFFTINSYPEYEIGPNGFQTGVIRAYIYNQRIEIQSDDVSNIKDLSIDIASIVEKGISFNVEMPEYHYSKLAELKIDVQAEAARDAMIRAEKIAAATDRRLGPMRNARMGVLQITPKYSNQVSDYGINDLSSIEKEITAVVNASFEIE